MPRPQRPVDPDQKVAVIRRFIDECVDEAWLEKYGANVVGVAKQTVNGKTEPCLVVYLDPDEPSHSKIGSTVRFNDRATGQSVDIPVQEGTSKALRFNKGGNNANLPRIVGGMAFTMRKQPDFPATTATLGGWVWDNEGECAVVISNEHAMGSKPGRFVFRPLLPDDERIGQVKRGTRLLNGKQTVDCAIASVSDLSRAQFRVLEIGPAVMRIGAAYEGQPVQKVGQSTGRTYGTVNLTGCTARVKDPANKWHVFSNCIFIDPVPPKSWAEDGDSGALVFDYDEKDASGPRTVVGLHFGNTNDNPPKGIVCEIDDVFAALDLSALPPGLLHNVAKTVAANHNRAPIPPIMPDVAPDMNSDISPELLAAQRTADLMVALKERLPASELGARLLNVLEDQQEEFVTLLATDEQLRGAAVDLLQPFFGGATSLDAVFSRVVDRGASQLFANRILRMEQASEGLKMAILAIVEKLPDGAAQATLGDCLQIPQSVTA